MTTIPMAPTISDLSEKTHILATASQQIALDTLSIEVGALKAMLPGLATMSANTSSSIADRHAAEAALEDIFDNMPV